MGREIRRVPPDWEHPMQTAENYTDYRGIGRYQPMHDEVYDDACERWLSGLAQWEAYEGGLGEQRREWEEDEGYREYYWDYSGRPPTREYYRTRRWTEDEATAYQIYENVTEGTPVSPVFASLDDLIEWLVGEGYSREAAESFARYNSAPSYVVRHTSEGTKIVDGIEALASGDRDGLSL